LVITRWRPGPIRASSQIGVGGSTAPSGTVGPCVAAASPEQEIGIFSASRAMAARTSLRIWPSSSCSNS